VLSFSDCVLVSFNVNDDSRKRILYDTYKHFISGVVCGEENIQEVVEELTMSSKDSSTLVARGSVATLGRLADRYPQQASASVVNVCLGLLDHHTSRDILADVLDLLCVRFLIVLYF